MGLHRPRPCSLALILTLLTATLHAQTALQTTLTHTAAQARGTVSVACALPGTALNCNLHEHNHAPMQSMFKYPLALTVLHLAETRQLFPNQPAAEPLDTTLNRTVRFLPADRIPHTFSPLQDRYPAANVDVPLRDLLTLAAGQSDNAASVILLRIAGGPAVVQAYIRSLGIPGFQLQDGEDTLARDPTAQYRNWIEPTSAVALLERLVTNPPLSAAANTFLRNILTASTTGPHRLRAGLPPGTPLAHKTGTSGEENGLAPATNDSGLITLPDGRPLALAVFVTDSHADEATRDRVIAGIAHAVYTQALHTH